MKDKYIAARNAYAYPPVGLCATADQIDIHDWKTSFSEHRFDTTLQLDQYHTDCLLSDSNELVLTGIYSVMYWGYITSGAKSVTRCTWISIGNSKNPSNSISYIGRDTAVDIVRKSLQSLNKENYGDALLVIRQLPHVGVSFGTKFLAFMSPEYVGVLDDKITKHLSTGSFTTILNPSVLHRLMKPKSENAKQTAARFPVFCETLNSIKIKLNQEGATWHDMSGASMGRFRALDVERALFSIAKSADNA